MKLIRNCYAAILTGLALCGIAMLMPFIVLYSIADILLRSSRRKR